jgi:hypothetical protein
LSVTLPLSCGATEADIQRRSSATGRSVDVLGKIGVRGSAQECADTLERFCAAGAERVYLQVLDLADLDQLEFFASTTLESVR